MLSSLFTVITRTNLTMFLPHLFLGWPRPLHHAAFGQETPIHLCTSRPSTTICQLQPHFTQYHWPPNPFFSRQQKGNTHIHAHPVFLAFLFRGRVKDTQFLGNIPYKEYLSNLCISLILYFLTTLTRTFFHAHSPYGHLHVVLLSHCTLFLHFSPHHLLGFGISLYQVVHAFTWRQYYRNVLFSVLYYPHSIFCLNCWMISRAMYS